MKRIITALIIAVAFCTASAQQTTTTKDTANAVQVTNTDTRYVADWEDEVAPSDNTSNYTRTESTRNRTYDNDFGFSFPGHSEGSWVAIIAIIMVFGFPIFIVFISLYFRYKNKQAKYRMVEKALESGQPIPKEFIEQNSETNVLNKGIKNVFIGLGLWIFLWTLTDEFGLGAIGLMIMFTGFGQIVIHYTSTKKKKDSDDKLNDNLNDKFDNSNLK